MTDTEKRTDADAASQEALREEILADARRQAERLLRRARQEAKDAADQADAALDAWRKERLAQAEAEAKRRAEMILAGVPVEVGRLRGRRIESLLQDLRDELLRRLNAREGLDARTAVVALAAEALRGMDGSRFILAVPSADRAALGGDWLDDVRRLAGRPELVLEAVYEEGRRDAGPVVRDAEGRQLWDNRPAVRLERLWPLLRRELAVRLALETSLPAEVAP